ncbi:MAG TPA: cytochrome c3 family protein [Phycisphaerae bacterium]|nr:cytochrome c3 family protein [Phycisphaerae bacterium]
MMLHGSRQIHLAVCALAVCWTSAAWAQQRVSQTVHNLSAAGPGRVRAPSESQVCVFCHAPHSTQGVRPLWNRELPATTYRIYESSTLDAKPGQPTGASKLCLSCHDGTIALGSVLSRQDRIRMVGSDYIPAGLTNLGTDLSDDHPISFHYTGGLAASDRQLASPLGLRSEVKLDAGGELQCTSCHDPHDNSNGKFMVMPNEYGALCTTCHIMDGWSAGAHRTASAAVTGARTGDWPYTTVAENACRSCHRPHTAGGPERLLIFEAEEDNCLCCHDGQVARTNLLAEIDKLSAHDPRRYLGEHDPIEAPSRGQAHVECADCHNPHAAAPETRGAASPTIGATLSKVRGLNTGGGLIAEARFEYEVCFRCHADVPVQLRGGVFRQAQEANLRLKFNPSNPSFHPVVVSSPSRDTVSLAPGLTVGTLIRCTDCHNNDAGPGAGGSGPDGPHGSNYDSLLERNYTVRDDTVESEFEYALCYKCHQRTSILSDRSFASHRLHIVDERTPCSACHDPHGISPTQGFGSDHTHLMNFDTQIVRPLPETRRLEFRDLGTFSGSCTLVCHGSEHRDRTYGLAAPQAIPIRTRR